MYEELLDVLSRTRDLSFEYVYLRTPISTLIERIEARGRAEEGAVTRDYLQILHDRHEAFLAPTTGRFVLSIENDGSYSAETVAATIFALRDVAVED